MITNKKSLNVKIQKMIVHIVPVLKEIEDGEPMDGDDVDTLCEMLKLHLNLYEGNMTEDGFKSQMKALKIIGRG